MSPLPLLKRLWSRPRPAPDRPAPLHLQPRGLDAGQLRHLQQLLQPLEGRLEVDWRLLGPDGSGATPGGDIVLVTTSAATPGRDAAARRDAIVCDLPGADESADTIAARFERRQRTLLAQLRALPQVRRRSPHFGASGWDPDVADTVPGEIDDDPGLPPDGDDSLWHAPSLPAEQEHMLRRVRAAFCAGEAEPLHLSYGDQARIEFDFVLGQAWLDPQAQRALRVQRRLPALAEPGRAGAEALPREPAAVLWDLGLAASTHRLLDQPLDWWMALVVPRDASELMRHATLPRHRRLAAVLAAGPTTAHDLLRLSGATLPALRGFLQGALMLDLVRWEP